MDTTADPHTVLRNAVAAAVMAPSTHNTQPWRFRIVGDRLEILADPRRHLMVIDAERRQLVQSCGCALFNARIAVRAMGYDDEVTGVRADEDPDLLATLHLGKRIVSTEVDLAMMRALPLRRTNRRPFLPRPVARGETDLMIEAAQLEGAWMRRLDPAHKRKIGTLVDEADRLQYGDPAFRKEISEWLVPFGSRRKDGIPFAEKEYGSGMPFTVMRTIRSPTLGDEFGELEVDLINDSPVVLVMGTERDDPDSWLACGQALQCVLLRATALGLSAAFLNQVLEIPDLRGEVAALLEVPGYPQQLLRLGYSNAPVHHAAPRRDLSDVLLVVE